MPTVDYHRHRTGRRGASYVECDTWAGGMSFAFLQLLVHIEEWHVFDSSRALPEAQLLDGEDAIEQQRSGTTTTG